jgi:hypothetical protein
LAEALRDNQRLQIEVDQLRASKRKKTVTVDPQLQFVMIEDIYKAHKAMQEVEAREEVKRQKFATMVPLSIQETYNQAEYEARFLTLQSQFQLEL